MAPPVNTKTAPHREVRFASFADLRRDLDALEAAHRSGTLTTTGNWTPGQNIAHIAAFVCYPYDGYPDSIASPPWIVRFITGFMKNRFIRAGMPKGVRIPGVAGGTVGADDVPFESALQKLRAALDRMEKTPPAINNPILGPLTHEEWMQMQCRHAELHLGFLKIS